MVALTQGISKKCKDSIAGLDIVYLFPYVKYAKSQIVINDNKLVTFPETTIYSFYGVNGSFTETQNEDDGGKFYDISLGFDLPKIEKNTNLTSFLINDYRAIIKDRNGYYRIAGLYNGLQTDLNQNTGDSKESFSGYKLAFQGQEINSSLFIDDLEDAGFIIDPDNYLLAEDGQILSSEDGQLIKIE